MVVERSMEPFERRGRGWGLEEIPVPVDLLVYTEAEWSALQEGGRLARPLGEMVWVWVQPG